MCICTLYSLCVCVCVFAIYVCVRLLLFIFLVFRKNFVFVFNILGFSNLLVYDNCVLLFCAPKHTATEHRPAQIQSNPIQCNKTEFICWFVALHTQLRRMDDIKWTYFWERPSNLSRTSHMLMIYACGFSSIHSFISFFLSLIWFGFIEFFSVWMFLIWRALLANDSLLISHSKKKNNKRVK